MSNHHAFKYSSSIAHIDYNDANSTLIICFTSGATYHYPNCHKDNYEALKKASSAGSHFHQHIKKQFTGIKQ